MPCLIGPGDADDVKFWEWPRGRIAQRSEEAATTTLLGRKERERKKDEDRFRKKEEKMEAGYAAVVLYMQRCQVAHFWLRLRLKDMGHDGVGRLRMVMGDRSSEVYEPCVRMCGGRGPPNM